MLAKLLSSIIKYYQGERSWDVLDVIFKPYDIRLSTELDFQSVLQFFSFYYTAFNKVTFFGDLGFWSVCFPDRDDIV